MTSSNRPRELRAEHGQRPSEAGVDAPGKTATGRVLAVSQCYCSREIHAHR